MAKYVVEDASLTAVADAIRAKTGGTEQLKIADMVTEIDTVHESGYNKGYEDNQENLNLAVSRGAVSLRITATSIGAYSLAYCGKLVNLEAPNLTSIGTRAISECNSLVKLDFPKLKSIGTNGIRYNDNLKILILRSDTVCSLGAAAYIGGNCNVYVPRALLEDYLATSSWGSIPDRIKALEDYTLDGTVTGEFDDEKALSELT